MTLKSLIFYTAIIAQTCLALKIGTYVHNPDNSAGKNMKKPDPETCAKVCSILCQFCAKNSIMCPKAVKVDCKCGDTMTGGKGGKGGKSDNSYDYARGYAHDYSNDYNDYSYDYSVDNAKSNEKAEKEMTLGFCPYCCPNSEPAVKQACKGKKCPCGKGGKGGKSDYSYDYARGSAHDYNNDYNGDYSADYSYDYSGDNAKSNEKAEKEMTLGFCPYCCPNSEPAVKQACKGKNCPCGKGGKSDYSYDYARGSAHDYNNDYNGDYSADAKGGNSDYSDEVTTTPPPICTYMC